MVDCPNCGKEVAKAIKCWTVSPVRHTAKGRRPEFRVGIFRCPICKCKFRSKVNSTAKPMEKDFNDLVTKTKEMHRGFTLAEDSTGKDKDFGNGTLEFAVEIEKRGITSQRP